MRAHGNRKRPIATPSVLLRQIFECIDQTPAGKNNEIQLTDAMARLLRDRAMYGLRFEGKRYDIGNKLDFLKTNIEFALKREDVGPGLREFIKEIAPGL